jgi:hypothetical protein
MAAMPMSEGFLAFREGSTRCALRTGHGKFLGLTEDSSLRTILAVPVPVAGAAPTFPHVHNRGCVFFAE